MKSAVFYGQKDIRIVDSPIPSIGDEEVLIQVKACGICGTDVHIYEGDKGAAEVNPPIILGHEFSGVVTDTGRFVTRFTKGDRVCIDPNFYCGNCDFCHEGIAHFCAHMIGYGTTTNGGFAEFCSVNQKQVYLLGEKTSFIEGAMAEPVACCLHGMEMSNVFPGAKVVVIGGGMIGQIMLQLARISGASSVALIEISEAKRKVAATLGTELCIDPTTQDVKVVLNRNGMERISSVIECVGKPSTIDLAIEIAGKKSIVMMFGLTKPDETVTIKPFEIFQKEIEIKASFINPYTQQRALNLIDSGVLQLKPVIYKIAGLDDLAEILGNPSLRANGKYVIDPSK